MLDSVNFSDTRRAYAFFNDFELKRAHLIFSTLEHSFITRWGSSLVNLAFKCKVPLSPFIRHTFFAHFCGGENLEDIQTVLKRLKNYNVGAVLDYAVESSFDEQSRQEACEEMLRVLNFQKDCGQIFAVFKPTGIISTRVLEKLSLGEPLSLEEKKEEKAGLKRFHRILKKASSLGLSVLVDAEESWFQNAIDRWVLDFLHEFNKEKPIIYQTIQLYRKDRLSYLKKLIESTQKENLKLGVKLVRGAYMEKERERAFEEFYESPIHEKKEDCDKDFDTALELCLQSINHVSMFVGTHNRSSSLKLVELMEKTNLKPEDPRIVFSQLFGMSDFISFNLASKGYQVMKYLPYGPVQASIPYLIRRSQENTSVQGQLSRELLMIEKEIQRRKSIQG